MGDPLPTRVIVICVRTFFPGVIVRKRNVNLKIAFCICSVLNMDLAHSSAVLIKGSPATKLAYLHAIRNKHLQEHYDSPYIK